MSIPRPDEGSRTAASRRLVGGRGVSLRLGRLRIVSFDEPIGNADHAVGIRGHLGIVRHQDDRDPFGIEGLEHLQDFDTGVRIQVAGGLVGQEQRRTVHQRPRNSHPLLLSAGHLRRLVVQPVAQPDPVQEQFSEPPA